MRKQKQRRRLTDREKACGTKQRQLAPNSDNTSPATLEAFAAAVCLIVLSPLQLTSNARATLQPSVPDPRRRHFVADIRGRSTSGMRRQRMSLRLRSTADSARLREYRKRRAPNVRQQPSRPKLRLSSQFARATPTVTPSFFLFHSLCVTNSHAYTDRHTHIQSHLT